MTAVFLWAYSPRGEGRMERYDLDEDVAFQNNMNEEIHLHMYAWGYHTILGWPICGLDALLLTSALNYVNNVCISMLVFLVICVCLMCLLH